MCSLKTCVLSPKVLNSNANVEKNGRSLGVGEQGTDLKHITLFKE